MNRLPVLIIAVAALLLPSCSKEQAEAKHDSKLLIASIEPQRNILEQLTDSTFTIRTMLARGADPETFEPSMSERLKVDSAEIYFSTGVLPFEATIQNVASGTHFANTSQGIEFIYDTHGHGGHEHHGLADPHYWSSIEGVRAMARNMARSLYSRYPEDSAAVSERLIIFNEHLDSVSAYISSQLSSHKGESFAVWHPSLSYFARENELKQISLGTEGKEMSARSLRDAIDKAKKNGVKVFFFQKEYDSRQAQTLNDGIGSRIIEIFPLDYDWEKQLKLITDEIARP